LFVVFALNASNHFEQVSKFELTEDDCWIVIASDGVWEHLTTDQVAQHVCRIMEEFGELSTLNMESEMPGDEESSAEILAQDGHVPNQARNDAQHCSGPETETVAPSSSRRQGRTNAAMSLVETVIETAAKKLRVPVHELKGLAPGRNRRCYLDDISVIIVGFRSPRLLGTAASPTISTSPPPTPGKGDV